MMTMVIGVRCERWNPHWIGNQFFQQKIVFSITGKHASNDHKRKLYKRCVPQWIEMNGPKNWLENEEGLGQGHQTGPAYQDQPPKPPPSLRTIYTCLTVCISFLPAPSPSSLYTDTPVKVSCVKLWKSKREAAQVCQEINIPWAAGGGGGEEGGEKGGAWCALVRLDLPASPMAIGQCISILKCVNLLMLWLFFSCPKQLNRWPCHSLTDWLTDSLRVLLLLTYKERP